VIGSLEKTKISLGGTVTSLVIGRARKFIALSVKLNWRIPMSKFTEEELDFVFGLLYDASKRADDPEWVTDIMTKLHETISDNTAS
jgi:hypothetical protein